MFCLEAIFYLGLCSLSIKYFPVNYRKDHSIYTIYQEHRIYNLIVKVTTGYQKSQRYISNSGGYSQRTPHIS